MQTCVLFKNINFASRLGVFIQALCWHRSGGGLSVFFQSFLCVAKIHVAFIAFQLCICFFPGCVLDFHGKHEQNLSPGPNLHVSYSTIRVYGLVNMFAPWTTSLKRFWARFLTRVSGRGKTINTLYSTTRPEEKTIKKHKNSKTITLLTSFKSL